MAQEVRSTSFQTNGKSMPRSTQRSTFSYQAAVPSVPGVMGPTSLGEHMQQGVSRFLHPSEAPKKRASPVGSLQATQIGLQACQASCQRGAASYPSLSRITEDAYLGPKPLNIRCQCTMGGLQCIWAAMRGSFRCNLCTGGCTCACWGCLVNEIDCHSPSKPPIVSHMQCHCNWKPFDDQAPRRHCCQCQGDAAGVNGYNPIHCSVMYCDHYCCWDCGNDTMDSWDCGHHRSDGRDDSSPGLKGRCRQKPSDEQPPFRLEGIKKCSEAVEKHWPPDKASDVIEVRRMPEAARPQELVSHRVEPGPDAPEDPPGLSQNEN